MTRVLVDLLFFNGRRGGTETVAREIYSRIGDGADLEFVGLAGRELAAAGAPWFPGRLIDSGIGTTNLIQWTLGEQFAVAATAKRERVDVIHAPANYGPLRTPVPLVLTVHDMLPFRHPEFMPDRRTALPSRLLIAGAVRASAHIVTGTEDARSDIQATLGVADDRISIVRPGSEGARAEVPRDRVPNRIFSLGNRMPHKNFPRLIEAMALIPKERRPHLTISGSHGDDPLDAEVRRWGLEDSIDLRSWLSAGEVEELYATSAAMVFPTLFEGFGLPVLEAMERGCPVLCSDIPVLREVGGSAAVYFDPLDPAKIALAIDQALARRPSASQIEAGYAQAGTFSWDEAAVRMRRVLKRAAEAAGR